MDSKRYVQAQIQHFSSNFSLKNEGNSIWKHTFYTLQKRIW